MDCQSVAVALGVLITAPGDDVSNLQSVTEVPGDCCQVIGGRVRLWSQPSSSPLVLATSSSMRASKSSMAPASRSNCRTASTFRWFAASQSYTGRTTTGADATPV